MARFCRAVGPYQALLLAVLAGCQYVPNYFRETGPSTNAPWESPSSAYVKAKHPPAPPVQRGFPRVVLAPESGRVYHWPLWFEDPFEDKGDGRSDNDGKNYHNVYRAGWEDYVALAYSPARFALNTVAFPVSAIVTPPWTVMVSDGRVSKQLSGCCDHDAQPLEQARRDHPLAEAPYAPVPAPIDLEPPAGAAYDPAIARSSPPAEQPAGGYPADPGCESPAEDVPPSPPPAPPATATPPPGADVRS